MPITNAPSKPSEPVHSPASAAEIEADFWLELSEIEAESMGWTELAPGCYFHLGPGNSQTVNIVGIPTADMESNNLLWLF